MITNLRKSKKKPWSAVFFSIFLVFLAIGVIGFLVITNWKINQRRAELQQTSEVLKKEIQILEEKIADLKAGISQTEREDYQVERLYGEGYFPTGATPVVVLPPGEEKEETIAETQSFRENLVEKIKNFIARVIQW